MLLIYYIVYPSNLFKVVNINFFMKKILLVAFVGLFMISMISAISVHAENSSTPADYYSNMNITGIIYNGDENIVIPNAIVTLECNGFTVGSGISDGNGLYSIKYFPFFCNNESTLTVSVVSGDLFGVKEIVIHGIYGHNLIVDISVGNIPMTPEFSFFLGTLTLISSIGVFFIIRRD